MGEIVRLPDARQDQLVVERLRDETVVYDLDRDRAHCLNHAARTVWESCDGRTTVKDAAKRLADVGLPADEGLVWMALHRLDKARLLADRLDGTVPKAGLGRREMIKALGLTGGLVLLLPAVESIVAPLAAQAATCLTVAQCQSLPKGGCTGLPICTNRTQCCAQIGLGCKAKNC